MTDILYGGITVASKHTMDEQRINRITEITQLPVIIWWESDILSKGVDFLLNELKHKLIL